MIKKTPPHQPLAILSMGMVTAMGDLEGSCAAMRVRFNNHKETDFRGSGHEPIIGSRAAIDPSLHGDARLVEMMVDALAQTSIRPTQQECAAIPLGLCTPEMQTIGRPANDDALLNRLQERIGVKFSPDSGCLPHGHAGLMVALEAARAMLYERGVDRMLVLAADSLINVANLAALDSQGHLLTPSNPHGLIPGEAAVAMLLGRPQLDVSRPTVDGVGLYAYAAPPAQGKRKPPVTGDELAVAIDEACKKAKCHPAEIALRIADCNGLDVRFEESALAEAIMFRTAGAVPHLWLPAECLGEVGTASALASIAWACHAKRKGYLPGSRVLVHASNEGPLRGAAILKFEG